MIRSELILFGCLVVILSCGTESRTTADPESAEKPPAEVLAPPAPTPPVPPPPVVAPAPTVADVRVTARRRTLSLKTRGRLVLGPRAVITHGSELLEIEADEILSEGATIESYPLQPTDSPGRDAGAVRIHARKLSGRLVIVSRGTAGADGAPGSAGRVGAFGASGSPAVIEEGRLPISFPNANALGPGVVVRGDRSYRCVRQPTSGASGGTGEAGTVGGDGGAGGNTGNIRVEIDQGDLGDLEVRLEPGKGGRGGAGGKGGRGGFGGAAGGGDPQGVCQKAVSGANGLPGPDGPKGKDGLLGRLFPACLRIGSETEGCQ